MARYDAYGTVLKMGTNQVETAVVVVTTVTAGDATFTLTASGMTGSPIGTAVTLTNGDSADTVATKVAAKMILDGDITALFSVIANGPNVIVTRLVAAANDGTLNLAYLNAPSAGGLTEDATSNDTTTGVALATTAQVTNLGGPSLSLDNADVTTHDSPNAWEENVPTVLRGGDVTIDIIYDPADDTHDGTAGGGFLSRLKNKITTNFSMVFPDSGSTTWAFDGHVSGFEDGAPHEGSLTAAVVVKMDGSPTIV